MVNVIFVHGISIRSADYVVYFNRIADALKQRLPGVVPSPCLWGDQYGARLRAEGASIPQYAQTKAIETQQRVQISPTERWELLTEDPTLELRLMTLNSTYTEEVFDPTGKKTPTQMLDDRIRAFTPSEAFINRLAQHGINVEEFNDAMHSVAANPVYDEARMSMQCDLSEYRIGWARAVIATVIRSNQEVMIDVQGLSALANALANELHVQQKGVMSGWLDRALSTIVTPLLRRHRGYYSDAVVPYIGDVIVYQGNGENIRRKIADSIKKAGDVPVVLLGHSLGGVACVDLLAAEDHPTVKQLITVGSQAPLFYEMDGLQKLRFGEPLPATFPAWLNIYDLRDFLSYIAEPIFRQGKFTGVIDKRVKDESVDNRCRFPQSHGAYFSNPDFWDKVIPAINATMGETDEGSPSKGVMV